MRWEFPAWIRDDSLDPAKLKRAGRNDEHPTTDALAKLKDGMNASRWREAVGWSETTFRRKREAMIKAKQVRLTSGHFYKVAA